MATLFGKPIGKVIKHPGSLTKKAKAAGKSISEFCAGEHDTHTSRQCSLAKTLSGLNK